MYYKDHPPPHFHAEYQGEEATFDFSGTQLHGGIHSRIARRLIAEWAQMRLAELELNWELAREGKPINQIAPLE